MTSFMENLATQLVETLRPSLDPDAEAVNVHGQPNEYHNMGFRVNFGRLFYAAIKASMGATTYEADCRAKAVELLEHDPDCIERKTGYALDALKKAKIVASVAADIEVAFDAAHVELTGATLDVDAYEARFTGNGKSAPKQATKARKAEIAALLAD